LGLHYRNEIKKSQALPGIKKFFSTNKVEKFVLLYYTKTVTFSQSSKQPYLEELRR
jgi:hypothetical protein